MEKKEQTFAQILDDLKDVVQDLDQGELSLEEALKRFETGVKLSRDGARRLKEVELRVEEILSNGELKSMDTKEN